MIDNFLQLCISFFPNYANGVGAFDIITKMKNGTDKSTPHSQIAGIFTIDSQPIHQGSVDATVVLEIGAVVQCLLDSAAFADIK